MSFGLPSSLGPFSLDDHGRIAPRVGEAMPQFLFQWRDRRIAAQLSPGQLSPGLLSPRLLSPRLGDAGQGDAGQLVVSAWLGRVPSSAAQQPGSRRVASFTALHLLLDALPADWRVRLLPDHQVRLEARIPLRWPASAVDLMAELTRFLLALAPYLDLLDEDAVLEAAAPAI